MPTREPADPADVRRLHRVSMEDGGEVYGGALAQEALDAVGARAMTLDRTIVVAEDFDPSDPEDQALYAHEAHHRDTSGGESEHHGDEGDEEETRAREIERMVLHRRTRGDEGEEREQRGGGSPQAAEDTPAREPELPARRGTPDPLAGYRALRAEGLDHDGVIRRLAAHAISVLLKEGEESALRGGEP